MVNSNSAVLLILFDYLPGCRSRCPLQLDHYKHYIRYSGLSSFPICYLNYWNPGWFSGCGAQSLPFLHSNSLIYRYSRHPLAPAPAHRLGTSSLPLRTCQRVPAGPAAHGLVVTRCVLFQAHLPLFAGDGVFSQSPPGLRCRR